MATEQSAPTLESVLAKSAAENDFNTISVGRMPVEDRIVYTASVHFEHRGVRQCEQGHSEHSIRDALHKAIIAAAEVRKPLAIMPMALPVMADAA